ncbi:tryptophan--tRNA ligase [Candidatus Nomurabacteria bacterium RIFCSPHIGHO2_02_FULL_33_12]|uniref:Tryptophan--tRNA ligase n=1 Tax=Candidatus Nomurabacteria bacterium RIFCSPLOWO2_01_FULL_33_17 TaxID=1801764 RepID=A0A1F6WQW5_9BACT|nr:MAG: tryptophan--tRNA ligase [Candidatus Nomurabacteria bacterium RIFCSPHIGHO2_02_FULL_33_12]OGI84204.1 MAG: tryptophan--tRNA ligase [Candidatus Nomurabacteria bacterium RIFCSPLOWO2_01_FULL_33_17]
MTKKILLSGIQSTGTLHIGNYFGAIKQFVELQDNYDTRIFVANFHSVTTIQDKEKLEKLTREIVIDYLACGLDPEKVTLFLQSSIPEVTELAWYFNCLITVPYLMRAHSYKDKVANGKEPSAGLFTYPMLMAADILIQDSEIVPVGQDQKQHIEFTRDVATKFNHTYGETFKLPEAYILDDVSIVPGLDGQKMSKSYGNTIPLFAEDKDIEKLCMQVVTDSLSPADPKDPETSNIFQIHKLFLNNVEKEELAEKYRAGGLGYKEAKEMLAESVKKFIGPIREKRKEIENNPDFVDQVLKQGGQKAQAIASKKLLEIRSKVGIL